MPRRGLLWASDNPLRVSGVIAAAMAMGVTITSLGARSGGLGTDGLSLTALAAFAAAHPAYPVATVVGLLVFLWPK